MWGGRICARRWAGRRPNLAACSSIRCTPSCWRCRIESLVYPAHGAGSLCGKAISKETVSTLGEQRRSNYALQPMSKEAFIHVVTADQPDAPAYFTYDAVLNSQERPTLDQALAREMNPLTLDDVLELQAAARRSWTRAIPRNLRRRIWPAASTSAWAGNLQPGPERCWIGSSDRDHRGPGPGEEAAMRLGRIGFDHVAGYLKDGLQASNRGRN